MMKQVKIKGVTQICSGEIGGCGRTIKIGESAQRQFRKKKKKTRRYYLCMECYDRKTY